MTFTRISTLMEWIVGAIARPLRRPTCFLRLPIHVQPSRLLCNPSPPKEFLLPLASINDRITQDIAAIHVSKGTTDAQSLKWSVEVQACQELTWVTTRTETKDPLF
jgi:hypothetical protein